MKIVTRHKGVEYNHSDFSTATKRKDLPQEVKDIIEKQLNNK
jgi:hypothetical protein